MSGVSLTLSFVAVLSASLEPSAVAADGRAAAVAGNSVRGLDALGQKFDFSSWGSQLNTLTQEAIEGSRQVSNITSAVVSKQLAPALAQATNITSAVTADLAVKGKMATYSAALTYFGKCPEFYALVPEIPVVLAPKLAEAFLEAGMDPSTEASCRGAAARGVQLAIDEYMPRSGQEKAVVSWIATDRAHKLCTRSLMGTLKNMEVIRTMFPDQYLEAIMDKLLLDRLNEAFLTDELDKLCGGQKNIGLYADRGVVVPLRQRLYADARLWSPVLVVAGLLAFATTRRMARCGAPVPVSDEENRLVERSG